MAVSTIYCWNDIIIDLGKIGSENMTSEDTRQAPDSLQLGMVWTIVLGLSVVGVVFHPEDIIFRFVLGLSIGAVAFLYSYWWFVARPRRKEEEKA